MTLFRLSITQQCDLVRACITNFYDTAYHLMNFWRSFWHPPFSCVVDERSSLNFTQRFLSRYRKITSYDLQTNVCRTRAELLCSKCIILHRSVDQGRLGVLTPWKYVRGSEYILTPKMSHSFIQNCRWITPQVSHHQGWKTCQTFFEAPERVWWLDLTDPDPHILRQIYATDYTNCIATARIRVWYRNISQDGTDRQTDRRTDRETD